MVGGTQVMWFILMSSWKGKAMKKLIAILSVALFSNQASALDFDEWVGFECFPYNPNKKD